jgi:hypothetical protein
MHLKKFNGDFYSMRMLFLEENWFLRMFIYMQILCVTESVQYFAISGALMANPNTKTAKRRKMEN